MPSFTSSAHQAGTFKAEGHSESSSVILSQSLIWTSLSLKAILGLGTILEIPWVCLIVIRHHHPPPCPDANIRNSREHGNSAGLCHPMGIAWKPGHGRRTSSIPRPLVPWGASVPRTAGFWDFGIQVPGC